MAVTPFHLYAKVIASVLKNDLLRSYSASSAVVGLTYKCQCKCVHCSAGSYEKDSLNEMSYEEVTRILESAAKLGVPRINLSGGEPLLRKDIFDIVSFASKRFVTVLESNGQLLDDNAVLRLKKSGVSCVSVSIDSYKPDIHDKLRGLGGCFEKAVMGIKNCVKNKIPCLISTYITSERADLENIKGIMALARKLKVMAVRVMPPRPVGSFSCREASLLSKEQERYIEENIDHSLAYFKGIPAPKICGIFIRSTFYVSPYGEVQPCAFMPLSFGNIREEGLGPILEKMWGHAVFKGHGRDCLILNAGFRKEHIPAGVNSAQRSIFPVEILK